MQVASQGRFDRRDEFLIDLDERSERAVQCRQDAFRFIESVQNCLRTFGQTLALGVELLQNLEARLPFRKRAVAPDQSRFGFAQFLLVPVEILFRDRNLRGQILERFLFPVGVDANCRKSLRDTVTSGGSFS